MIDAASTIFESIGTWIFLMVLAWALIVLPTTVALSLRRGLGVGVGAACAILPIVGWGIILYRTRGAASPFVGDRGRADLPDDDDDFDY